MLSSFLTTSFQPFPLISLKITLNPKLIKVVVLAMLVVLRCSVLLGVLWCSLLGMAVSQWPSIYQVLRANGLPMGLLPSGVKNYTLDSFGRFEVYLGQACNAMFENEIHFDMNVSGTLRYGQMEEVDGIAAQDLFLWFPVKEIRVDVPSSGLIYFDVGVVSKQFSLSSFETPRDCTAIVQPKHLLPLQIPDDDDARFLLLDS